MNDLHTVYGNYSINRKNWESFHTASPHSRPLYRVQRRSALRPLCRNVHGAASVTIGPERTFVDGAANDSSEPSLPTFCTAAKDRFREIAICSSVEPAQTGHSPTFGDAAVRPVNTDIRCNGKISPLANSQFADKLGLCRCSYCSSRAPRISGWPFAALQLISQKQSLKPRSKHPPPLLPASIRRCCNKENVENRASLPGEGLWVYSIKSRMGRVL